MDMVTGLPTTPRGNNAFFVYICRLTKLLHVAPCHKSITAEGAARLFFDTVYLHHGWPVQFVTDRDPRFTSDLWTDLAALTNTTFNMSTANHPQTDGQSENSNKTVITGLRHYASSLQTDWDLHLTPIVFAYNDATHTSTRHSPFFLTYGHHPLTPAAIAADAPSARPTNTPDFLTHIRALHQQAKLSILHAQNAQATNANKHRRHLAFAVGDKVWLDASHLHAQTAPSTTRKLGPKWFGPYTITKANSTVTYTLDLPPHHRRHPTIHVSHLKPFIGPFDPATVRQPPAPDVIDGVHHYHVETFLNSRGSAPRRAILVKWSGYSADHNQWIPAKRLRDDLDPTTFDLLLHEMENRLRRHQQPPSSIPPPTPAPAPPQPAAATVTESDRARRAAQRAINGAGSSNRIV